MASRSQLEVLSSRHAEQRNQHTYTVVTWQAYPTYWFLLTPLVQLYACC